MATGFSTRSGSDGYRLNFDTDNLDYYLLMQKIARHCVDGKPASDVAPVRHGRLYLAEDAVFRCSECGRICYELDAPYCYCGARMDKEDDHEAG